MKIVVNSDGERLDKYLSSNTSYSRELVTKMIDDKKVLVNGNLKKGSYKVKCNDVLEYPEDFVVVQDIKPCKMDLDILYEDNDIMVINKPSGVVVHPGNGNFDGTLVNGLMDYTNSLSDVNGEERVGIVHRIDKDTSGIILIAKSNKAHEVLAENFKNHDIKRTYIALLDGVLPYESATVDAPIKRDEKNFKLMGVYEDGKKAITHLKVIKRFDKYTLCKLNLETGRTHQIRVHMKYIGFPVHNDPIYNTKSSTSFGQFLHSSEVEFLHPITNKKMHFKCDLPKEFNDFLENIN